MKYVTPSNCLTISRLFLSPILIPWSIITYMAHPLLIFSVLASTDMLDGWCARMWQQETRFGKWLDPLADKIVLASVLFPLVYVHYVHWAVALIFVLREFVVLSARHIAALVQVSIPVSGWGKVKTIFQFSYIALCLIADTPSITYVRAAVLIGAIVTTVGSMLQYAYQCTQAMHKGSA